MAISKYSLWQSTWSRRNGSWIPGGITRCDSRIKQAITESFQANGEQMLFIKIL
ncbi:hypothetical protein HanPSC8_Chr09g0354461 [Helianthus annuus]|nr:hypothetical protein HanPSC8_Chr09g0354461 [Helianthus annuus]